MGRGKVSMNLIHNDTHQKATFHRRKQNLLKKTYELATLCDIPVCTIVFGPELGGCSSEPETWPQNHEEVRRVIERYKSKKGYKRSLDLHDFYERGNLQLKKQIAGVRRRSVGASFVNNAPPDQLREVLGILDRNIGGLYTKIELIKNGLIEPPAAPELIKMEYSSGEGITTSNMKPNYVNPLDTLFPPMQYSSHALHAAHQMVPFEPNYTVAQPLPLMMFLNGLDYSPVGNASGNNFMYTPLMVPTYNNPTSIMMENQILNPSFGSPSMMPPYSYYVDAPVMQPMLPWTVPPSVSSGRQPWPPIYNPSDIQDKIKKFIN